jgi:hypothetical protein
VIDLILPLTLAYLTIGVVVAAAVDRPQLHAVVGWPVVAIVAAVGLFALWAAQREIDREVDR